VFLSLLNGHIELRSIEGPLLSDFGGVAPVYSQEPEWKKPDNDDEGAQDSA